MVGKLTVSAFPPGTVNVNDTVVFTVAADHVQTISYLCTIASSNASVANGTLPPGQTSLSVQVPAALLCTFSGTGANLIAPPQPFVLQVGITPPPAAAPNPSPTPSAGPVSGTWQSTMPTAVPLGATNFPRYGECARGPTPAGTCSPVGAQCTYYISQTNPLSGANYNYFSNYRCSP